MEYKVLKTDGKAKRAEMKTVHGTIQTPVFMNVGTVAAIKGAVSTDDLREIGCQVELSNTYHLHVRTGDKLIKEMGGIREFMNWDRPVLTDSGGFQVFLAFFAYSASFSGFESILSAFCISNLPVRSFSSIISAAPALTSAIAL